MTGMQVIRLVIVSLALGFACAACTGAAPARAPASPEPAPAPMDSSTNSTVPAPGRQDTAGQPPRLVSSHGPLPGIMPAAGAVAGAPGAATGLAGAAPHGALRWDAPAGWIEETPSNPMRAAQYRLAATAGDAEDGECVVFYFGPGQGGDAASNAARWVGMFTRDDGGPAEHRVTEDNVGGRKVTRVEASGIYHPMSFGGPASPPQPGYMMLGAIVPGGDANWFFRCAGPRKTIAASRDGFDALVRSIR